MNKHLHRIIFNKARGVLMAVAECASSHSRGDARVSRGADIDAETAASWLLRPAALAILLVTSGTVGFIPYAEAQIVADPTAPRNQQPIILNAANGVPVVNIQTPSAAGVSRNTYSQFDVQANGAILNNARSNVQTQQGGWVQGNPWLATGSARVILNEVNSSNPSQLRGYVEVAGSRAQVVIANPAGVTCDGCGFINANRVTLTTGSPILNGGNLDGFRVERGQILIQGNGLDTRQADYTDLIARAITVNAGVWANTLKLVAGANQVDAEAGTASPVSGVGAAPSVAIDVGQLGGMYAGKIVLVGTEAGVGVRNAGQIGASIGEVNITADGRLINSGVLSTTAQTLSIASRGLDNTGTLSSQADVAITSQGDIVNAGLINAGRELKLAVAGPIDNSGTLSGQRLDLSADRLDNTGILRQTGSQGLALSVGNITNQAAATLGHLVAGATVPTPSSSSSPTTSGTADAPSSAAAGGEVNSLPATPEVLADGRIALRGDLANSGQLTANGRVEVSATRLDNRGTVNLDTLSVTGDRLLNAGGTIIVTDLSARVTTVDNSAGQIKVARQLSIDANDLSNAQGSILYAGTGNMGIQLAGPLNNTDGILHSAQGMTLTTGALDNDAGLIQSSGALVINTQGQLLSNRNTGSGGIVSQGALTINSGALDNSGGYLGSLGPMIMVAGAVNNAGGLFLGGSSTQLTLASLDNSGGQIQSAGNLSVNTSSSLGNTGGLLRSGATLILQASQIDNNQTNSSNKGIEGLDVVLTAPILNNSSGTVRADNNLTFTSGGSLDNRLGLLSAGNTLTIKDAQSTPTLAVTNTGGLLIAGQKLDVTAASLTGDGLMVTPGDLTLALTGNFNNSGTVQAGHDAKVSTQGTLTNSGTLVAGNLLELQAGALNNQATGTISATTAAIATTGTLTNRGLIDGFVTAIDAGTLNNVGTGRIYGDYLSIAANTLNNLKESGTAATIAARTRLDLAVPGVLYNDSDALIFSGGALAIGGALDANRQATGRAGIINNNGGTIQSLGAMSLVAQQINNTNANFSATIVAGAMVNKITYYTSQGTITSDQVSWKVDQGGWDGSAILDSGNASPNSAANTTLILVKLGDPYADPVYAGYFGTNVYAAPGTAESCDLNLQCTTVDTPATVSTVYAAGDPIWARFGVTPPSQALPGSSPPPEPVPSCDAFNICTTPTPAQITAWQAANAAWQAAAAPYIALQNQLNSFRSTVNAASRLTVYSYVNENYQPLVAQVLSSVPGQILSGGNMLLDAAQSLTNDKSRIIAGGTLSVTGQSIANIAAQVSGIETHTGISAAWGYAGHDGASTGHGCDCSFYAFKGSPYAQDFLVTLTSPITVVLQNQSPGSGAALPLQGSASSIGAIASAGTVAGVTGGTPVAVTVPVNLTVPATSLYTINPGANSRYLIETDPRFANYRTWLSSDYILAALAYDPVTVQKRLGDGFYEQQLIREQVAQLTGQRFLIGYDSDEAQYRALMDNSVTYAKAWQLRPGVALTAAQVAQLTSDIVWLVEQTVTLPDGTRQQVLVPQVYAMPRAGDLKSDGTLLAGNTVRIAATGDLMNSGTVAGRTIVDLSAENVRNLGGRIAGEQVSVRATNDLDNIGGRIEASRSLMVTAGRDLNVVTTTVSGSGQSATGQFAATQLDRLAGLYVTGDQGLLVAVAGRDLNLVGAEVKNSTGDTQLLAGRDLNLDTVTVSQQSDIRYSQGNTAKFAYSKEIGTTIQSDGKLAMTAGQDISIRAGNVSTQGDLTLSAGRDVSITAGRNEQSIDVVTHTSTKSKKLLGGSKDSKDFTLQVDTLTAQRSSLSGDNVTIETGRTGTLTTEGARVTAVGDLKVKAGTILLDAAYDAERSSASTKLVGKTTQQRNEQTESINATGSVLIAGRNLSLESSGDTTVIGSALDAGQGATIKTGGNLSLLTAESSTNRTIDDYVQTKKRATTLAFEEKDVHQLLSTITVGSSLDIAVGGNFTADIGEKNADGSLRADRMTANGIERGDYRQQVDVKKTGVGADSNPTQSQVLGDLTSQGIQNGANDSFTPKAVVTGGEALQQYLNSGLVQVRSNPQLAAQLQNVLGNTGGTSLTFKDDSGNISLTVAGQAKVQEVFNTLKLSESFDTKKLTDQGTAQIVTLVAAVVLTVCTAGAGAASLGAMAASAMGATATTAISAATAATILNAAIIGMSSTMIGQLAGGASFDKAFQAGIKAGATSALMAGVSVGIGELVGSPPTNQVNGSTVQAGTNAASSTTSSFQAMGTPQYWAQTGLNALAKGTLTAAQGGKFEDGVIGSVVGSLSASGAGIVGQNLDGLQNIIAHAVLGCVAAVAGKQDCGSGALGGAASATLARLIDVSLKDVALSKTTSDGIIAGGSMLGSMAIAAAAGRDVMTTGDAAANELLNNYFQHPSDYQKRRDELAACGSGAAATGCQSEVRAKYAAENIRNDAAVENCSSKNACVSELEKVKSAQAEYTERINELQSRIRSLSADEGKLLMELKVGLSGLDSMKSLALGRARQFGASLTETELAMTIAGDMVGAAAGVGATSGLKGGSIAKSGDTLPKTQMLGENGPQISSKTIWKGGGQERIDVENPNPGQRPGQIHYQDNSGNKYLYDPSTNSFPNAPNSVNKLLGNSDFASAIQKGLDKYLGGK